MNRILKKLRNHESLTLFDKSQKLFIRIQLNKKEKFICWERWVKKAGGQYINHNLYLSLKDVINIANKLKTTK